MKCTKCAYENPADALVCGLCAEVLRAPAASVPEYVEPPKKPAFFDRPWVCLGIGLLAFPVAKLLWLPNYMFNFLTTLVHECGHAACAWLMGMPSIPAVSLAGGGVTQWQEQAKPLAVLMWIGIVSLAWLVRRAKVPLVVLIVVAIAYPFVAFTKGKDVFAIFGGILFEVFGAAACLTVCLGAKLERPFERPLYAVWGWWMLLNRMTETYRMLTDNSYRLAHRVIESGLAAGLADDMTVMEDLLNVSPHNIERFLLLLGLLSLAISIALGRWMRAAR